MECKGISHYHIMTLFISFNIETDGEKTCFAFWPKYRWPHEGKQSSAYDWTLVLKNNEKSFFSIDLADFLDEFVKSPFSKIVLIEKWLSNYKTLLLQKHFP